MKLVVSLLIFAAFATFAYGKNGDAEGRSHLRKQLFEDYDTINIPDNVKVNFGISLLTFDVDEDKSTLEVDAWLRYMWKDSRLAWDNRTNGINLLRISPNEIWKPDITLYNSANLKDMVRCWDSNPILYSTGEILWVPPCQISTHCNFTLEKYPYGEQKCALKFGSWTYDAELLDIGLYGNEKKIDVDNFGSKEWKIIENGAQRNEKYYPCCPEAYVDVTFNLTIQRVDPAFLPCDEFNQL